MATLTQQHQLRKLAMSKPRTSTKRGLTLARALEKAQIAVERDKDGNLRGALSSYRSAKELLSKAKKRVSCEEDAGRLDAIASIYDRRIQELRDAINNEPRDESDDDSFDQDRTPKISKLCTGNTSPLRIQRRSSGASTSSRHYVQSCRPERRDSHQQWPLTPEFEMKATMERYSIRSLPPPPASSTPRLSQRFDDFREDDDTVQVLDLLDSGWWEELIEGRSRWSLSSERTLVASPGAYLRESRAKSEKFARRKSRAESPTDSIRFWSPPPTPKGQILRG
ncbi:hypothetical protein CERZMDRAFT_92873 [Cercospora zeae-maydis SCOH1-5]|uniref:MIT domain-containing protein n=1 Tax=Cercospora zeae-maydis SCOH1-5 TaxID=717836 RepID=A0A6A6FTU2_9PEZI|nr:hypothetical protein CERZMDRAFT_92873 [Cercospora zeae-maydis SCOH1-5]